jgi:heme oxygenase
VTAAQAAGLVRSPDNTLRDLLRTATRDIHERLHHHRGLAAVQSGIIDRKAYTALLGRLYGFHRPFEAIGRITPKRTCWLENDLTALGVDGLTRAALPRCVALPFNASREYRLGARYVVEGSALGGQSLGRQLDDLLGTGVVAGRQFFTGYGAATGEIWRDFLAELEAVPDVALKHVAVVDGAIETFAIFEQWLKGWDDSSE